MDAIVSHIRRNVQLSQFNIFLSAPPEEASRVPANYPLSIMAYRIGRGFHLYRTIIPNIKAQIMDIDFTGFTGYGPHQLLISEIMRECAYCGYSGISLGIASKPEHPISAFCSLLCETCSRYNITVYLPEMLASCCNSGVVLIPGQNTYGTYDEYLDRMCSKYGASRLALELERVYSDFVLPSPSAVGSILSQQRFCELCNGPSFYSPELCSQYSSYISSGKVHLVLWDDADSLNDKISHAKRFGIQTGFLYFPHVRDIVGDLVV